MSRDELLASAEKHEQSGRANKVLMRFLKELKVPPGKAVGDVYREPELSRILHRSFEEVFGRSPEDELPDLVETLQ